MKKYKIILVFLLIISFIFFLYNLFYKNDYSYVILNEKNIWVINKDNIKKINSKNIALQNYKEAILYQNDKKYNGYVSLENKFLNFYGEDYYKKSVYYNSIITVNETKDLNIKNITNEINDEDRANVKNYVENKNEILNFEDVIIKKINLSDNVTAYSVSTLEETNEDFIYIFIKANEEFINLYSLSSNKKRISDLHIALDINSDGYEDIILKSDIPGSAGNECFSLYIYDKNINNYNNIIKCEEGE